MKFFKRGLSTANIRYVLFLLVFTAIAGEIIARIYMHQVLEKSFQPKFQFDSYRIYRHVPGFSEGDGIRDWITINAQGFRRTTDVSITKPERTFRVFLMGGSAAHGISSAPPYPVQHIYPDETIDHYLEELLAASHPDYAIEVINAAVTGYQVFQHTAYLLSELLDYEPDLIVFVDGANDHYADNEAHQYYHDNRYQYWSKRLQSPSLSAGFDFAVHWLSQYSAAARGLMAWKLNRDARNFKPDMTSVPPKGPEAMREAHQSLAPRQYLRSVRTNLDILNAEGVDAVVCLQPMLVLRDTALMSEGEMLFLHSDPFVTTLYPDVVNELSALCEQCGVPFIDLNAAFNNSQFKGEPLFIDYCHLTPFGGRVIAEQVFPSINEVFEQRMMMDERHTAGE
jgi:hypothetical protein